MPIGQGLEIIIWVKREGLSAWHGVRTGVASKRRWSPEWRELMRVSFGQIKRCIGLSRYVSRQPWEENHSRTEKSEKIFTLNECCVCGKTGPIKISVQLMITRWRAAAEPFCGPTTRPSWTSRNIAGASGLVVYWCHEKSENIVIYGIFTSHTHSVNNLITDF